MSEDAAELEAICRFARSLFERGLTGCSSGNVSVRRADGSMLVTPTGGSFGMLYPARIAHVDAAASWRHGVTA